jgi:hypothetical protein
MVTVSCPAAMRCLADEFAAAFCAMADPQHAKVKNREAMILGQLFIACSFLYSMMFLFGGFL